jgi:hypothetical protein
MANESDVRLEIKIPAPVREKLSQLAAAEHRTPVLQARHILETVLASDETSLRHTWAR